MRGKQKQYEVVLGIHPCATNKSCCPLKAGHAQDPKLLDRCQIIVHHPVVKFSEMMKVIEEI